MNPYHHYGPPKEPEKPEAPKYRTTTRAERGFGTSQIDYGSRKSVRVAGLEVIAKTNDLVLIDKVILDCEQYGCDHRTLRLLRDAAAMRKRELANG